MVRSALRARFSFFFCCLRRRRSLSDSALAREPRPIIRSQNADAVIFGMPVGVDGVVAMLDVDTFKDDFSLAAWVKGRRRVRLSETGTFL